MMKMKIYNRVRKDKMFLWFLISFVVCLKTNGVGAQDSESSDNLQVRRATSCETKDGEPGYCLSVVRCRRVMPSIRRFKNPNICFFERDIPHVCCPVKLRGGESSSTSRPISTSRPTRTTTTRRSTTTTRRQSSPISSTRRPISSPLSAVEINPTKCGRRAYVPAAGTAFVVNGEEAPKKAWPWMAGIRVKTFGHNTRFLCGGSLISRRHILTAAHCFGQGGGSRSPSDYKVILGSHYRGSDGPDPPEEEEAISVTVKALRVHEEYKDNAYDNDVAVMLLDEDVPSNDWINPVCLPTRPADRTDPKNVTVIGWGDLSFGGVGSKTLQEATFEVVSLGRCRGLFRQIPAFSKGITSNMLCAGDIKGQKDACQNDSGGPLLADDKRENTWTQVGIVSFGYKCAERGYPGVYARVTSFVPWIRRAVRRLQ